MKWLIGIALACVVLMAATQVSSPAIISQLPMSRMTRAKVTANNTAFVDPEFRGLPNWYAVIDIPAQPMAFAITEIVKSSDTMCDVLYLEINGQFVGAVHTNNIFVFGTSSIGRHDAFNFQLHSPIFVPPGSNLKLYAPWFPSSTIYPTFYFVGYPLNIGEF